MEINPISKIQLETHPYIDKYPIDFTRKNIFIGTFPPNMSLKNWQRFEYFYGTSMDLWSILSKIYLKENLSTLEGIFDFLQRYSFSITDIIYKCSRKSPTAAQDKDLSNIEYNPYLKSNLLTSSIENIYLNSRSGETGSLRLFLKAFDIPYMSIYKSDSFDLTIAGKAFKIINLYSCSPSALSGIMRSENYKEYKKINPLCDICDFRVLYYKNYLPKPIN